MPKTKKEPWKPVDLSLYPQSTYLEHPKEWEQLAEECHRKAAEGLCVAYDTETVGCDPEEDTPVYWARPVIWSVAIADGPLQPRGFKKARGFVMPWQALFAFQRWFKDGPVWAFNARYDRHSCRNLGVYTYNVRDVLDYLRVLDPGHDKYGLKDSCPRYLGYSMPGKFKEVFKERRFKDINRKRKWCSWDAGHDVGSGVKKCETCKSTILREQWTERTELSPRDVPFTEVTGLTYELDVMPGDSSLWSLAVLYSGLDSIATAELASLIGPGFKGARAAAKIPNLELRVEEGV